MDSEINRIHSIIAKSLTGQLDNHELKELEAWKLARKENLSEYNDFVELWIKSGSLALPSAINHHNAFKIIRNNTGLNLSPKRWLNIAVQVAAVLVLSIIFSGVYTYMTNERTSQIFSNAASLPVYHEIKAAFGTQAKIELADGTVVFLNSGSKLRFPQTFDHQEQRKVLLDGEGYFSVTKDPTQPFVVQVNKLNIKVLGTTFNVEAYNDNTSVNIALVEGSVLLQEQSERGNKDLMILSPNQVANLNKSDNVISKMDVADLYKYTAWINGRIVFYNDPIQTVVNKLAKWYNVDITIADKRLENYRFTGTFIDESLEQILNILSLTSPMTFDIKSSVKQVDNSMSKRKIILKGKSSN
jgi:ferric-dicitrate binding protein FerR (iron transport regulator)